jgi:hypothetical protein
MWIRLLESPTNSFRTLFFKGSAEFMQRTPSAWLLPESNHVTLRLSTNDSVDSGKVL